MGVGIETGLTVLNTSRALNGRIALEVYDYEVLKAYL